MDRINQIAMWIGYAMMISGGCFFLGATVYLIFDWFLQKLSYPGAWLKIACELHRQRKFKWQKQEDNK